jgi:hypothetical protein
LGEFIFLGFPRFGHLSPKSKFQWVKRKRNDREYLGNLGEVEIHGETFNFEGFGWED